MSLSLLLVSMYGSDLGTLSFWIPYSGIRVTDNLSLPFVYQRAKGTCDVYFWARISHLRTVLAYDHGQTTAPCPRKHPDDAYPVAQQHSYSSVVACWRSWEVWLQFVRKPNARWKVSSDPRYSKNSRCKVVLQSWRSNSSMRPSLSTLLLPSV